MKRIVFSFRAVGGEPGDPAGQPGSALIVTSNGPGQNRQAWRGFFGQSGKSLHHRDFFIHGACGGSSVAVFTPL